MHVYVSQVLWQSANLLACFDPAIFPGATSLNCATDTCLALILPFQVATVQAALSSEHATAVLHRDYTSR